MESALISIIVPVYNVEKYLKRCLDSIITQTYKNIEIIVVDDGTKDNSDEICDKIAKTDSRIHVYHKSNGGLSDARNYGAERANGEYIAFIDSDDYIAPNYIEYLYTLLRENNADISCCILKKTTSDIMKYGVDSSFPIIQSFSGYQACDKLFLSNLYLNLVVAYAKLIKTSIVKKYPFPIGKKHEDEATTAKYFYEAKKVVVGNHALYAYYQNENSITHVTNGEINEDAIWALKHRAEFFENMGETALTEKAYYILFTYLAKDSLLNNGRCNDKIKLLLKGKRFTLKHTVFYLTYKLSPALYKKLKKL